MSAHEPPDDAGETDAREREAGQVELAGGAMRFLEAQERERDQHDADRDVQPEDPVPGDAADDSAADERAERDREPGDAAPRTDEGAATIRRDAGAQDRQRQRRDDRSADALRSTCCDQRMGARRERGCRGRDREDAEADREHAPPSETVAERRAGQEQNGERQRVGVDRPLEALDARVQVLADHGQGGRDHEVVEGGHEHRHRGDCESPHRSSLGTHGFLLRFVNCL